MSAKQIAMKGKTASGICISVVIFLKTGYINAIRTIVRRVPTGRFFVLPACILALCYPVNAETIAIQSTPVENYGEIIRESTIETIGAPSVIPFSDVKRDVKETGDTLGVASLNRNDVYEMFKEYDRDDAPGCAVAVYHKGETIVNSSFGMANLDYGISLSDSTSFFMAAIAKQVTAAAASLLIIRNELNPEARVADYLEKWPDWAHEVRVKHLFNHTSGLPDIFDLMDIAGISLSDVMDLDDYMSVIRNGESLNHRPGTKFSYTNSGYTVLAKLVETVTGDDFSIFTDKELLQPLEMTETHFHDDRYLVIPNRAISYTPLRDVNHNNDDHGEDTDETAEVVPSFRQIYLSNFQGVGPVGLYSRLRDWSHWEAFWSGHRSLPNHDESAKLKRVLTHQMVVNGDTLDYGKGLEINEWQGLQMEGHSGSFMGFETDVRRFPEYGLSVLTLCNREDANPGEKNRALARNLLIEPFESFLSPYGGTYYNEELQVTYTITVKDGTLSLERRLAPNGFMEEEERDKWRAGSWDLEFFRDHEGDIRGFRVSTDRAREVEFLRK